MESGTAEHLALEHLDPIDVSFDNVGVPRPGKPGGDRKWVYGGVLARPNGAVCAYATNQRGD